MTEELPHRRSTDHIPADLENFVHQAENRGRRVFLGALASLSVIALTTAVTLVIFGVIVDQTEEKAQAARDKAESVQISNALAREKVCSQTSNRKTACRALFERVSGVLTIEQRERLACQSALYLKGPTARKLLEENPQCSKAESSP